MWTVLGQWATLVGMLLTPIVVGHFNRYYARQSALLDEIARLGAENRSLTRELEQAYVRIVLLEGGAAPRARS